MKKVLVANRGEIAVRILRACREMGVATVAVHSEVDGAALHVAMADSAVSIGPAPPRESYLSIEALIDAARRTGADAVHPGYGFLSENAAFAEACAEAGLTFIGPSADAIRIMGDKVASRARMRDAGVPLAPGTEGADASGADASGADASGADATGAVEALVAAAEAIPLPLMVKAAGGGGGKGMRIVRDRGALAGAIASASREATSAFGNGTVYVERFVENPRHVEVQVLADTHGNVVHVFERECSIQRRHQKLIEESPSPAVDPELRARMGEAAVRVATAVDYVSAGTVEFLFDPAGEFYFLEMNTRIQVEHPVTEMVVGLDLVAWQIRIARGERLTFEQSDLAQRGHAIEARLYAEDAAGGFMPSAGRITRLIDAGGPGVRVDEGVTEGGEVSTHYDPILSKVIAWGETREAARRRLVEALRSTVILGIRNSIAYLIDVLEHPAFRRGEIDTSFLEHHAGELGIGSDTHDPVEADMDLISAALIEHLDAHAPRGAEARTDHPSPWRTLGAWRVGGA